MSSQPTALSRLLRQVRAGGDALVLGGPLAHAVAAAAARQLTDECRVVEVGAGTGVLSLSALMAQLSGREELAAHDDAVLAAGFKRLSVPDVEGQRIVLLLDGSDGVQRAALRFVQHVAKGAPALLLVVIAGPGLLQSLEEPDFAGLRARLEAEPVIECAEDEPDELPLAAIGLPAIVPLTPMLVEAENPPRPRLATLSMPVRVRRRLRPTPVWVAASVGALALGVWLGHVSAPQEEIAASDPAPVQTGENLASAGPALTPVVRAPATNAEPAASAAIPAKPLPPVPLPIPTPPVPPSAMPNAVPVVSPPAVAPRGRGLPPAVAAEVLAPAVAPTPPPSDPVRNEVTKPGASPEHAGRVIDAASNPTPSPAGPERDAELVAPPVATAAPPEPASIPEEPSPTLDRPTAVAAMGAPLVGPPDPAAGRSPANDEGRTTRTRRSEARARDAFRTVERRLHAPRWVPREPEPAEYESEEAYLPPRAYAPPPAWAAPRPEQPYIGIYTGGPYGARMFRYER